ncbi:MAG TPA: response regulator, partial [Gammaproteobacteria bacterium]|nr:response regulator [Gammaproteobacteria bacterium]
TDQAKGIDLLITDVVMPQIDGFTLAEQARKQRPELKVIFVSGYNTVTSITPVAGFTDTLAKPFQTADLLARTATMLKQSNDS